jgi:hypothetical protein
MTKNDEAMLKALRRFVIDARAYRIVRDELEAKRGCPQAKDWFESYEALNREWKDTLTQMIQLAYAWYDGEDLVLAKLKMEGGE